MSALNLSQLLQIPHFFPAFLFFLDPPGIGHISPPYWFPISLILSLHLPVPKSSDHPFYSWSLLGYQNFWKSCSPWWLLQQSFHIPLVISFCYTPQWHSKPSPFPFISCFSLRLQQFLGDNIFPIKSRDYDIPSMLTPMPISKFKFIFLLSNLFSLALEELLIPFIEDHWSIYILNLLQPFPETGILH